MQTKAFIFLLSTAIYLLGLFIYADSRALAGEQLKNNLARLEPTAVEFAALANSFDQLARNTRRHAKVNLPQEAPEIQEAQVALDANPVIVNTIRLFNEEIAKNDAEELAVLIEETADRYAVDPLLVTALVSQESAFHADAVSPVGALGYGQLMPYTAEDLGVDPSNPAENLDGCVRYLADNLSAWSHTNDPVSLALASYNAGPGAVSTYGGVPPYEETQNYVNIITGRYYWLLDQELAQRTSALSSFG